ncbi:amino acid adenylation domain-containing protein, partial [Micromonospora marina]
MTRPPRRRAAPTPEQRARFQARLRDAGVSVRAGGPTADPDRGRHFPLTDAQLRFWLLEQIDPGNPAYHMAVPVRLSGHLDVTALHRAVRMLVARHEALRTVFGAADGTPWQRVVSDPAVVLTVDDLCRHDLPERDRVAERIATAEATAAFDLGAGPLLRVRLVRLAEDRYDLLITMHHIVGDGWSVAIVVRELSECYTAVVEDREPRLAPLPVQYPDWAVWQRRQLDSGAHAAALAYWRERLADVAPLGLPHDAARPVTRTFSGGQREFHLDEAMAHGIRAFGQQAGASPFVVLLAALAVLLSRQTGRRDLLVGTPVAGRDHPDTAPLVGCFLNLVAVRCDLHGDPTFGEVVDRVRQETLRAFEHQQVPFERVQAELGRSGDLDRAPLFEVLLNMVNVPAAVAEMPGVAAEFGEPQNVGAKFDLTVYVQEHSTGYRLSVLYNTDLFHADRIAALMRQWQTVLRQGLADPRRQVDLIDLRDVPGGPPAEPAVPAATPAPTVPAQVALAVTARPEAVAVSGRGVDLTYGELDHRAGQVAARLRRAGLRPGDRVVVLARRTPELPVALLGIWRAGGVCVVLDADAPESALAACVDVAAPVAALGCGAPTTALPGVGLPVIPLADGPRWLLTDEPAVDQEVVVTPDDVAYLAFTTGSTARPRAVLGTHGPLGHFLRWQRERFTLTVADRTALLAGIGHDPLLRDLFAPLTVGATLCLPPGDVLAEMADLAGWLHEATVKVVHITPALATILAATAPAGLRLPLRLVFLGGDLLTRDVLARLRAVAPQAALVNVYGATETPQVMSWHDTDRDQRDPVPVGVGVDGVRMAVHDRYGRPCGIGELGEIVVRTRHLTLGYVGDPAATADRFRPDPAGSGTRLFRTADLGRIGPDGAVEFAGRTTTAKIRGIRVEPAEVEATLRNHPQVADVGVLVTGTGPDAALVACVVPTGGDGIDPAALAAWLGQRTTSGLVPDRVVLVDALPRAGSGKLVRSRLAGLLPAEAAPDTPEPPVGETERLVAEEVATLLGQPVTDRDSSFFGLGGDSVRAMQLAARLRDSLGRDVPVRWVF